MKLKDLLKEKSNEQIAKGLSCKQLAFITTFVNTTDHIKIEFKNACKRELDRRDLKDYTIDKSKYEKLQGFS